MRPDDQLKQRVDDILDGLPAGALTGPDPGTSANGDRDAWLLVRRVAEQRSGPVTDAEYGEAASALRLLGNHAEADALAAIARTGTVLAAADREWRDRYRDRVPTLTEQRDAELLRAGRVRQQEAGMVTGIDGAVYTPGVLTGPAGATVPAVVAATHAGTAEVVTFRAERNRQHWLTGRRYQDPGAVANALPLGVCSEGPECRVAWEERTLAHLLRHGDSDGAITASLPPTVFSTHTRFELYMAFLAAALGGPPNLEAIRDRLAARALRAPDWAASYVGRPCGHHLLAYAERLTATPVTSSQAESAVAELIRETGQAASASGEAAARKTRRPTGPRPVTPGGTADLRQAGLRRPELPAPGTVPRM